MREDQVVISLFVGESISGEENPFNLVYSFVWSDKLDHLDYLAKDDDLL